MSLGNISGVNYNRLNPRKTFAIALASEVYRRQVRLRPEDGARQQRRPEQVNRFRLSKWPSRYISLESRNQMMFVGHSAYSDAVPFILVNSDGL